MDSILALAILFTGAFIGVCILAIFYVASLRNQFTELPSATTRVDLDSGAVPILTLPSENPELLSRIEVLERHIATQSQQLEAVSRELGAEIQAHAQTLKTIIQQLEFQTSLLANLNTLLDAQETPESLADQLTIQESMLREIHGQLFPLHAPTLPRLLADQTARLEAIQAKLEDVDEDVETIKARKIRRQIRLTDIKGIGPVFATLLYEAGVENFQQLAALTPEELRNLVDVPDWREIDADSWIEQAQTLLAQQEKLEALSEG